MEAVKTRHKALNNTSLKILTKRREIFSLYSQGKTYKEIGKKLKITPSALSTYKELWFMEENKNA